MTLSPVDNPHLVSPRPDLPPYELGETCAVLKDKRATDNHHIFRRSLGKGFRDAWWAELSDGQLVPNRVGLSAEAHQMVTENKARILWLDEEKSYAWLEQIDGAWHHVAYIEGLPTEPGGQQLDAETAEWMDAPLGPYKKPHEHPAPGSTCDRCQRRVPYPKKASSPKTFVSSYRGPLDDKETHESVLQAAAEAIGIYDKPHWRFGLSNYAAALILQGARLTETGD